MSDPEVYYEEQKKRSAAYWFLSLLGLLSHIDGEVTDAISLIPFMEQTKVLEFTTTIAH